MFDTVFGNPAEVPLQTVLFFASGYAGYHVANTGYRDHHKQVDIFFLVSVYGFFGLSIFSIVSSLFEAELMGAIVSFGSTCVLGAVWRKWGRHLYAKVMRKARISHSNDGISAWAELSSETGFDGTSLVVELTDGTLLFSDDLHRFVDCPNGPCTLGGDGDVLIYVTDIRKPGDETKINESVRSEDWGDEITYIPSSQIKRVDFRRHISRA